ncbi:MULE transposase domain [Sesbania bispinosa]|nr:MULE transposase domain [Sesbania bispinosa]
MSPLVVFARVNHHNQTIVFGSGLIANKTEETYVWLLKQFAEAMKGKLPSSVITNGDLSMRTLIRFVFLEAHHRLCAWNLLRNATSNISNPRFTTKFRRCMLGDYDVGRFRLKWNELIDEFNLHENQWVGRYVHYRNNLTEFLKLFSLYLAYTRQRELEADFDSIIGDPVLQTNVEDIESRSCSTHQWYVSMEPCTREFKCSCLRMKSIGIPGEHVAALLNYLEIKKLPQTLVFRWWTKNAKNLNMVNDNMGFVRRVE